MFSYSAVMMLVSVIWQNIEPTLCPQAAALQSSGLHNALHHFSLHLTPQSRSQTNTAGAVTQPYIRHFRDASFIYSRRLKKGSRLLGQHSPHARVISTLWPFAPAQMTNGWRSWLRYCGQRQETASWWNIRVCFYLLFGKRFSFLI